jgi:hypothetical protein
MFSKCKKMFALVLCVFMGMHVQPAKADGEFLRKGLGVAGAALIVNGLSKVFRGNPRVGTLRVLGGATISLGGICSDIIYKRLLLLSRRLRNEQQRAQLQQQGLWGSLKAAGQDLVADVQEVGNGHVAALGNVTLSKLKMRNGLAQLKKGQILTGLDAIYDGIYHKIREYCARLLYQIDA